MLISYYDEDVPNMYRLLERIQTDGLLLERLNEYGRNPNAIPLQIQRDSCENI